MSIRHFLIFTACASLFLSSCEKHDALLNERARIEQEIRQGQEALRALDSKFESLGTDAVAASVVLERQHADWTQKNAMLEQSLAYISSKCSEGEETLKQMGPRVAAYKAKFLR